MYFLITDIFKRKSFDLIFLLKKKHKNKIIFCHKKNSFFYKLASFLIYRSFNLIRLNSIEDFDFIQKKYSDKKILFFPVEEDTIILFYNFHSININIVSCLPDKEIFDISRNKKLLADYCNLKKITSPKVFIKLEDVSFFPVIVKPIIGSGSNGIKLVYNLDSLYSIKDINNFLVQQYLPDSTNIIGAFAFAINGEIISFYFHRRIRTFPKSGGVSVFASSIFNDSLLNDYFKPLVKDLNWSGLIMVEYLHNELDGLYYLIEINPRIWGSILLSDSCDSFVIDNFINHFTNKPFINEKYKENFKIRWIFPYDFFYWIQNRFRPVNFLFDNKNTVHINFSNSNIFSSIFFVLFTYFKFSKFKKILH